MPPSAGLPNVGAAVGESVGETVRGGVVKLEVGANVGDKVGAVVTLVTLFPSPIGSSPNTTISNSTGDKCFIQYVTLTSFSD
jgi:hypothetical protein